MTCKVVFQQFEHAIREGFTDSRTALLSRLARGGVAS
jgi:hypothetical protein